MIGMRNAQSSTFMARLTTDEPTARRLMAQLAECFEPETAASSAFETADGSWSLAVHFSAPPDEWAVRSLVGLAAGKEAANALVFSEIAATDWVKTSLAGLAPVSVGRFLVHGRHDRARLKPNQIGIEIEAALAFGTGHHGTTRGCLEALDRIARCRDRSRRRTLDVGTGSGVLAIAAARVLRARVLASDIDGLAVAVARHNAALNGVGRLVEVARADGVGAACFRRRGPFDLVFANILLGPLKRLAPPLQRLLAPDARLVLSGLVSAQAPAAVAVYRAHGLVLERKLVRENWVTLVLRRPGRGSGSPRCETEAMLACGGRSRRGRSG